MSNHLPTVLHCWCFQQGKAWPLPILNISLDSLLLRQVFCPFFSDDLALRVLSSKRYMLLKHMIIPRAVPHICVLDTLRSDRDSDGILLSLEDSAESVGCIWETASGGKTLAHLPCVCMSFFKSEGFFLTWVVWSIFKNKCMQESWHSGGWGWGSCVGRWSVWPWPCKE